MRRRVFPDLKLLHWVEVNHGLGTCDLSRVGVIGFQHLLSSTGSLIESLIHLGVPASSMFFMGKYYSTNPSVVRKMRNHLDVAILGNCVPHELGGYAQHLRLDSLRAWDEYLSRDLSSVDVLIVLDDGASLINSVPDRALSMFKSVIAVEQTTYGMNAAGTTRLPVVNVAGSAVKRNIEPAFISRAVIDRIESLVHRLQPGCVGIVGYGNIGQAIFKDLSSKEREVIVYDSNPEADVPAVHGSVSVDDVFERCDLLIGATGTDISSEEWLNQPSSPSSQTKVLASASSGDAEFNTLLRAMASLAEWSDALDDIHIPGLIRVLRGGTPVNFDGGVHSVSPEHIQLTRALLLLGVLQAIESSGRLQPGLHKLDAIRQTYLVREWLSSVSVDYNEFDFHVDPWALTDVNVVTHHSIGMDGQSAAFR